MLQCKSDTLWLPLNQIRLFPSGKATEPEANGYPSKHALNETINLGLILRGVAAHVRTALVTLTFPIINGWFMWRQTSTGTQRHRNMTRYTAALWHCSLASNQEQTAVLHTGSGLSGGMMTVSPSEALPVCWGIGWVSVCVLCVLIPSGREASLMTRRYSYHGCKAGGRHSCGATQTHKFILKAGIFCPMFPSRVGLFVVLSYAIISVSVNDYDNNKLHVLT